MDRVAAIAAQNIFSLAHPEFYEPLSSLPRSDEYRDRLTHLLPSNWELASDSIWLHALSPANNSAAHSRTIQGFKIHVSSAPSHALMVLDAVVPICARASVDFKIAGDSNLLHVLNSKLQGRGHSGKFMTIYPTQQDTFLQLIEQLYVVTRETDAAGPYVLSDQRYKDSRVLSYRYGGFWPLTRLNPDGTQSYCLQSPTGEFVTDQRYPYFELPDWVDDPFAGTPEVASDDDVVLDNRYAIHGVLGFSNAGGVYHGTDQLTDTEIIIKEARPYTNWWTVGDTAWDAVHLLEHEYEILRRLQGLDFVPEPIALIQAWEHLFLIEKRVDGIRLNDYCAKDGVILAPYVRRPGRIESFCVWFRKIAAKLIQMVQQVQERGVFLGDLSPRNILVNAETMDLWLIDFESAVMREDEPELMAYATKWGTPGFVGPERASRSALLPEDDFYSLGQTLYNCVVPIHNLFELSPGAESVFLDEFVRLGLPERVRSVISALTLGAPDSALVTLSEWEKQPEQHARYRSVEFEPEWDVLSGELSTACNRMADYILKTANHDRSDRLWPAHYSVFTTNPLNLNYGACGPAVFLHRSAGRLSPGIVDWLLDQPLSVDTYPPGLGVGLAGIVLSLLELGQWEKAEEAMSLLYQSPLLYAESNLSDGAAGWGLVSLHCARLLDDPKYLEQALNAGEYLLQNAQRDGDYLFWRCKQHELVHYGFGFGASGIALFLLYLYEATARTEFRECAIQGLEYDLSHKVDSELGWRWHRFENDTLLYPYWMHGSAGIASVLIRFYRILGTERYRTYAQRIAEDNFIKYSFVPSLFEGLAGIGELMMDMYCCTGEQRYREKAADIAETILWFGIDKPEGLAFPGRWLTRISNDYATGSAGIGLFLQRVVTPGARFLVDL